MLFVSNGLFVFAGGMLVPLYAIFATNVGADILTISFLTSVLLVSKVVTVGLVRQFGDKIYEREFLVITGFLIRAAAWCSLIFFPSVFALFIIQLLLGVGDGVGSPAFRAILATHLETHHEIKRYAEWELIVAIAGAVGALIGGLIVTEFGFEALFTVMSILAFVSACMIWLQPRSLL